MINETLRLVINNDLDKLFIDSLKEYLKHNGEKCNKCKIIQGEPYLGWKRYYCKCLGKKINKKFSNNEKELFKEIIMCQVEKENEK